MMRYTVVLSPGIIMVLFEWTQPAVGKEKGKTDKVRIL